jgi:hypothetical protein
MRKRVTGNRTSPRKRSPKVEYPEFDVCFQLLKEHKREFKTVFVPPDYVSPEGVRLGRWYRYICNKLREGKLGKREAASLKKIGISHNPLDQRFKKGCEVLKSYLAAHPPRHIPEALTHEGFRLGMWLSHYVHLHRKGTLKPQHAAVFSTLGVVWEPTDVFSLGCKRLAAFRRKYGHTRVLKDFTDPTGFHLYNWTRTQRQLLKRDSLTSGQKQRLRRLGVTAGVLDDIYSTNIAIALRYKAVNGVNHLPANAIFEGVQIGQWVAQANYRYRKGKVAASFVTALKDAGLLKGRSVPSSKKPKPAIPVDPKRRASFEEGISHLRKHKVAFGTVDVPERRHPGNGFNLGRWLARRRRTAREGKLPDYQRAELEALGVILQAKGPPSGDRD